MALARPLRDRLLCRLGTLARGQLAEVLVQDPPRGQATGCAFAGGGRRRRPTAAVQRLLGAVAPHQLSGRDPDGARPDAGARISRRARTVALSTLLRRDAGLPAAFRR